MNERDGTDRDARHRQLALFRQAIIGELDIEKLPRGGLCPHHGVGRPDL